jgi:hypothetical protein
MRKRIPFLRVCSVTGRRKFSARTVDAAAYLASRRTVEIVKYTRTRFIAEAILLLI